VYGYKYICAKGEMISLIIKLILLVIVSWLWRAGGSDRFPLSFRRIGVPVIIAINTLINQNWIGPAAIPLMIGAISIGYGVNSALIRLYKGNKVLARATCGLAYAVSATPILWGNWWALGFHALILVVGIPLAGTQRFKGQKTETEEGFVGLLFGLMPILG